MSSETDTYQLDLEWLGDLSKGQSFTTCSSTQPAKSFDFGGDGFTASLTDSHELLQLTQPDPTCGVTFVRGAYPDRAASILSRSQQGGYGTFGTCLLSGTNDSDVELGERKAQGWINFRWPYAQYELVRRDAKTGAVVDGNSGTCETMSFVRNGVVYQLHRLKWGRGSSLSDSDDAGPNSPFSPGNVATARFRVGGGIRFSCPCSAASGCQDSDCFDVSSNADGLHCRSSNYQSTLSIGFNENGNLRHLTPIHPLPDTKGKKQAVPWIDLSCEERVTISPGHATYLVSTYAFQHETIDSIPSELPDDIRDYLGVDRDSLQMTDRLWTALCAANYEAVEAVEFCVVGRCVEQVLGVTSVPIIQNQPQKFPQTALISNIMTSQYVDVQAAFFQIRLLAKIYHFIDSRELQSDFLEMYGQVSLNNIRDQYLVRLADLIRKALSWLFMTDLKQGRLLLAIDSDITLDMTERLERCLPKRAAIRWDTSYNRGCYATMAAWYVFKTCPAVITQELAEVVLLPLLPRGYEVGMERARRYKQPTSKGNVLQWLHFSSILLLYDMLDGARYNFEHMDIGAVRDAQRESEKHVSRLKTNQADRWSAEHDEVDYVLLLAEEMGLDLLTTNGNSHHLAMSRGRQAKGRIRNRKRTTKFHPGPKPWMAARSLSNGPWELLAIHHESYLRVAEDEGSAIAARDRLFEFMLSDYSFMASWDRADENWIGTWWDIEPVAMICATLLDLKLELKLRSAPKRQEASTSTPIEDDHSEIAMSESIPALRSRIATSNLDPAAQAIHTAQAALIADFKQSMTQILRQVNSGDDGAGPVKAVDWVAYRPGPICLPDWWLSFQKTRLGDVTLAKALKHYFECLLYPKLITEPARPSIKELGLLTVFDISQPSRIFSFSASQLKCGPTVVEVQEEDKLTPTTRMNVGSWTIGQAGSNPGQSTPFQRSQKYDPLAKESNGVIRIPFDHMVTTLDKGLVDIGIKYRVFFAPKVSPSLVSNFVHKWHPDALQAIEDHFGTSSRFVDYVGTTRWITSIAISHWRIRNSEEHQNDIFTESHRQNGKFPPDNVIALGSDSVLVKQHAIEEQSSSLMLSGYPSGQAWICTVWSSVTDEEQIAPVIKKVLPGIMDRFIHQQGTGRCLSFLVLLGHLCQRLAAEYNILLTQLDDIMGIGDKTLLEGLEDWWGTAEAVNKLKKMLWGWEALRVINDKLSSSLSQIQRAQETTERTIKQQALQHDADLIQETNNILDEFKKRYGMLMDVHDRTQLKIKQVTGLRDGISTITNVLDNKTTIQQGNNVRVLTYITIAYLPLGFVIVSKFPFTLVTYFNKNTGSLLRPTRNLHERRQ
ncbi:hypothetical protein QBC38DRAFT_149395 [Podospora fimiseda]|uniref:Uncharacterized protein n=1 Tax=Podospora fimiseda TaxID=252190 RepID=A0AAN6YKN6_9PEZI|nr:hypothetical protein QBC38DRAFT_149395 [Podospora fimiseda]